MRRILTILALAALCCQTIVARNFYLRGGKLSTIDDSTVETFGDDMNFCFAYRFSDGTIHLNHSKGVHTVTEYGCADISLDNGKTWSNRPAGSTCGINTFEGKDGGKYNYGTWNRKYTDTQTINVRRYNEKTGQMEPYSSSPLKMPFKSQCFVHRDAIRLPSGKILATYYGHKEGDPKSHIGVFETSDEGKSWQFTGVMADDPEGKTVEGPDEATIFQLKDGRICALFRDDGNGYVKQCFSSDEGRTWTKPEALTLFPGAASPNGRVLADGTIVAVTGRPNLYLLVDFTGTGTDWQKVEIYRGGGSSYASVLETGPGEILIIYDESNFGGRKSPTGFSRIHASRFAIAKGETMDITGGDPRAKNFDYFYSPASGKMPLEAEAFYGNFHKKSADPDNYAEITNIPERPHPVLRLNMHGDNEENRTIGNYHSFVPVASGRRVMLEIEFRMNDAVDKGGIGQFHTFVPAGGSEERSDNGFHGYVGFALNAVKWMENGKICAKTCDLGNSFHRYVYIIDADAGTQELYLDGAKEPLFVAKALNSNKSGSPSIIFGDGSGSIYGNVDVSYIGWKILK